MFINYQHIYRSNTTPRNKADDSFDVNNALAKSYL